MAPPTSKLLLKAAGIEKGSSNGRREVVGSITYEQLKVWWDGVGLLAAVLTGRWLLTNI